MEHRFGSTFFLFLFSCNATDHGFLLCSAVFQIIQSIRMTWWPPLSACSRPMTTASLDTSIGPWLKPSKKENVPQYKHVLLMQTSLVLSLYRLSFFFDDKFTSVEKNCLDYQYVDNWLLRVITSAISPPFFSFFLWNANCKVGCFLMATVHYMSILTRLSDKGLQFFQLAWTVHFCFVFVFNFGNIQSWYCRWHWSDTFFHGCIWMFWEV